MKLSLFMVPVSLLFLLGAAQVPTDFHAVSGIGLITLLNTPPREVAWPCLENGARRIIAAVDDNRIQEFKTLMNRNNAIVREFLLAKGMRIAREGGRENVIIPFKYRGKRFLLFQGEDYRLVGLKGQKSVNFNACFKGR